jgi:hypothetical protein
MFTNFVKSNFKAIIIMMLVSVLQNYDNSSWDYQIHVLSNSGYSVVEFEQIDIVPQYAMVKVLSNSSHNTVA